jgi:hypothetical protein
MASGSGTRLEELQGTEAADFLMMVEEPKREEESK